MVKSRTMTRVRTALAGAAFASLLLVTACAGESPSPGSAAPSADPGDWDSVVASANKEGHLTIYANYNPIVAPKIEAAFEKDYPDIDLEILHVPNASQGQQRIQAEVSSGQAIVDVYVHSDLKFVEDHIADGYFAKIIGPNTQTPEGQKVMRAEDHYLLTHFVPYGYGWNTQIVSGKPTLTQLLDDPSYKGRVALVDWDADNLFALALLMTEEQYIKDTGDQDFMKKLAALQPTYFSSATPLAQAVASGQMAWSPTIAPGFIPDGTPVDFAFLSTAPAGTQLVSILGAAPHPNAAQVYANWALTRPAQEILANKLASALPDIPGALLSVDQIKLISTLEHDDAYFDKELARLRDVFGR